MSGLTQEQYAQLSAEGYSPQEIAEALGEVEREQALRMQYGQAKAVQQYDPRANSQLTAFSYNPNDNLIKWQLEVNEILERTEHVLREDMIKYENGHVIWKDNDAPDKVLNDFGVKEIMRILSSYVNRNTILSYYTVEEVYDIVYDFGVELNDLFYQKYELMGMDNPDKRKSFGIFYRMLVDTVRNTYSRAIGGKERESLREARQFSQVENINPQGQMQGGQMNGGFASEKRSVFNPMRYIVGKYKL